MVPSQQVSSSPHLGSNIYHWAMNSIPKSRCLPHLVQAPTPCARFLLLPPSYGENLLTSLKFQPPHGLLQPSPSQTPSHSTRVLIPHARLPPAPSNAHVYLAQPYLMGFLLNYLEKKMKVGKKRREKRKEQVSYLKWPYTIPDQNFLMIVFSIFYIHHPQEALFMISGWKLRTGFITILKWTTTEISFK